MKKTATALLVLLLASNVFGAHKLMYKKKKKTSKQAGTAVVNDTKIKSVLMGRSACFGTCPAYTIEVFETGLLRYTGKSHVEKPGVYEKNISAGAALGFIKEFSVIRPDTLHYMYKTMVADLPGIYYFITYQDSVKKVLNADAGPVILREWAKKFDEFAQFDDTWKKGAEQEK